MCILDHGLSVLGQGSYEVGGDFAARIHPLHLLTISVTSESIPGQKT